mmetsp:Transcript_36613/g.81476  ORF Transcript_36613/g.81476 Transcript_36613/m.81476 type:complete len:230 (-) Transcript_36613:3346-4035(-)
MQHTLMEHGMQAWASTGDQLVHKRQFVSYPIQRIQGSCPSLHQVHHPGWYAGLQGLPTCSSRSGRTWQIRPAWPCLQDLVADVLQLLEHLTRAAVQLLRNAALLGSRQRGVLGAQVSIHCVLDREVRGAVRHVVAATQGGVLLPEVHLQVREEVNILPGREGVQRANAAHHSGIQNDLLAARLQACPLQRCDRVSDMEVDDVVQLVRCSVQLAQGLCQLAASRVLLHLC